MPNLSPTCLIHAFAALLISGHAAWGANPPPDAGQLEFFEKNIRPVLADKCYKCHSADSTKVKGGLLLDTREGLLGGGDTGPAVVPGHPKESLLLKALHWEDKDLRMPPEKDGGRLPDSVIADFEKWIAMGALDPRSGGSKVVKKEMDMSKARDLWTFQAPKAGPVPAVKDTAWPRSDVDRFLLAAQEARELHPVADADRRTLLRRVYFDLIGLPPTPAQSEAFAQDKSPEALTKVVDVLLASPQFGERWGRHWLDTARFAESTGKERNYTFPEAWRYRDWVIEAVNADLPYDQFIVEQIAGDLLPARDAAERDRHVVATGFLAVGTKGLNEKNREIFRMDVVDDQIDTTSRAVLGLTVACARCHDHKFDPIPTKDYYALAGIFRSTTTYYGTTGTGAGNRNSSTLIALTPPLAPALASAGAPAAVGVAPSAPAEVAGPLPLPPGIANDPARAKRFASLPPKKQAAILARFATTPEAATPAANSPAATAAAPVPVAQIAAVPTGGQGSKAKKRRQQNASTPGDASTSPKAMGVSEGNVANAPILIRGEVNGRGDIVPRGVLSVLTTSAPPTIPAASSGRLELARWLTSRENPLTARVMANRVWQHLFGEGLVRTADNFGATGEKPSNPELLDTLAVRFMRDGWSVKKLVRSLVLSHAYQLSSTLDARANEVDPDNRLVWRASPRRLDAEAIRDAMLTASGKIELGPVRGSVVANVGDGSIGKGIRPELFTNVSSNYRSVYLPIVRDFVPEALDVFDFAEPSLVVATRDVTNVPVQALYLLNNDFVRAQAAAMAQRIVATPLGHPQRIALAYQLALSRQPSEAETARAGKYLLDEGQALLAGKRGKTDEAALLSWSTFCQALFASAEFRYLR